VTGPATSGVNLRASVLVLVLRRYPVRAGPARPDAGDPEVKMAPKLLAADLDGT